MSHHPARALLAALISFSITSAPFAQIPPYAYRIPLAGVDAKPAPGGGEEEPGGPEMPLAIGNAGGTFEATVGVQFQLPAPSVSGGKAPYHFSLDAPLPSGFTFANGAISGTPGAAGQIDRIMTIADSGTQSAQIQVSIVVNEAEGPQAPELVVGSYGGPYATYVGDAFQIPAPSVTGGTAPFTFALDQPLPANLTFADGVISGSVAAAGEIQRTVTVTDSRGQSKTASVSISVSAKPQLPPLTAGLNAAPRTGLRDNATFPTRAVTAQGGTAPYAYELVGSPPAGLTVNATTGALSGGPFATGPYSYAVRVTDSSPQPTSTETETYPLEVYGAVTAEALTATGRGKVPLTAPVSFSNAADPELLLVSGSLPPGVAPVGTELKGTPSTPGTYTGTLRLRDKDDGASATLAFSVTVQAALDFTFAQASTPIGKGFVGTPIAPITASAANALGPVTFAEAPDATYPTTLASVGLTLSPSGQITGTPTQASGAQVRIAMTETHNGETATVHRNLTLGLYNGTGQLPTVILSSTGKDITAEMNDATATTTASWSSGGNTITVTFPQPVALDSVYLQKSGNGRVAFYRDTQQLTPWDYMTAGAKNLGLGTSAVWKVMFESPETVQRLYFYKSGVAAPIVPSFGVADRVQGPMGQNLSLAAGPVNDAVGGVAFAVNGNLPDGVSVDPATGLISGVPTTYGIYNVELSVTDSRGYTSVKRPIRIQTLSNESASSHVPTVTFTKAGGTTDVTVDVYDAQGSSSINGVGELTYTFDRPVTVDSIHRVSSSFGSAVSDYTTVINQDTGEQWANWSLNYAATAPTFLPLKGGQQGTLGSTASTGRVWTFRTGSSTQATIDTFKLAYNQVAPPSAPSVAATGGNFPVNTDRTLAATATDAVGAVTWGIAGQPPANVSINAQTGVVSFRGTVTDVPGTKSFTITATDSRGLTAKKNVTLTFS